MFSRLRAAQAAPETAYSCAAPPRVEGAGVRNYVLYCRGI